MFHNKGILIFSIVILMNNSADAMKRSLEDGIERLPKRIKVDLQEKKKTDNVPQRHTLTNWKPTFFCEEDILRCSYTTIRSDKIKEHHRLHNDPNVVFCDKACDFLGANERVIKNHASKWHASSKATRQQDVGLYVEPVVKKPMSFQVSSFSREDLVLPINEKKECGYCGREGSNMKRHMETYHTPRFGKRSYFQCFSLYRNVPHAALPVSDHTNLGAQR